MNKKLILTVIAAMCLAPFAHAQSALQDVRDLTSVTKYGNTGQPPPPVFRVRSDRNCTAEYFSLHPEAYKQFQELTKKSAKYKIILVPGFLTQYINGSRFDILKVWLNQIGADYTVAPIDTAKTRLYNAVKIKETIQSAGKPCILISHSKGGIDTLEALVKYPEIRSKVKGWISFQTPFAGSPLADKYINNELVYAIFLQYVSKLGGSALSLDDLSTWERKRYHEMFRDEISQVTRTLPVIALASRRAPENQNTILLRYGGRHIKGDNDGLVPTGSAVLENADYVLLDDLDHSESVDSTSSFDRMRMNYTLLQMLFNRMGL